MKNSIKELVKKEIQSNKIHEGLLDKFMDYLDNIGKEARKKEAVKQIKKNNPEFDKSSKEFQQTLKKAKEDTKNMSSKEAMDFYNNFLKTGKL